MAGAQSGTQGMRSDGSLFQFRCLHRYKLTQSRVLLGCLRLDAKTRRRRCRVGRDGSGSCNRQEQKQKRKCSTNPVAVNAREQELSDEEHEISPGKRILTRAVILSFDLLLHLVGSRLPEGPQIDLLPLRTNPASMQFS